jgi:hypothetical protein
VQVILNTVEGFRQVVRYVIVTELEYKPALIGGQISLGPHGLFGICIKFRWSRLALNEDFGSAQHVDKSKAEEGRM